MAASTFEASLWRYDGDAPWHFVTVPVDLADELEATSEPRPFGSVPVRARIGATTWETSLFPDKEIGSYVLPIKRAVRDAESISERDAITVVMMWNCPESGA